MRFLTIVTIQFAQKTDLTLFIVKDAENYAKNASIVQFAQATKKQKTLTLYCIYGTIR